MDDNPHLKFSSSPLLSPSQSTNGDISEDYVSTSWSEASSNDVSLVSSYDDSANVMLNIQASEPVVGEHGHIVQFYYDEEYLYNSIISFVAPGLKAGGGALIIATKPHLVIIENKLRERNVNVQKKKDAGRLLFFDAHDVLKALQKSDGNISGEKFEELIEGSIDELKANSNGIIYAFGEVVNILSQRKQYQAALVLESKWNDFMKRRRLQLLCGYALTSFSDASDIDAMTTLCQAHGHINTAEHTRGDYAIDYNADPNALRNHQLALLKLQQRFKAVEAELERRKASEASLHKSIRMISETTENVLSREKDRYQNVLSSLPVGVYGITFGDDDEFYINKRFSQLVSRSENEIRAHGWIDVIHPDDRKAVETNWPFCNFRSNQEYKFLANRHEYRLIHSNGDIIWVKADTTPTTAEDGHILGYLHTLMDITELKNTERGRLEAKQAAEEHQRHRAEEAEHHKERQDQWIDSLCHELRNPLNGISGNVELLEDGIEHRRAILSKSILEESDILSLRKQLPLDQESILAVRNCVAQQKVITDDVLSVSKLELGKVLLKKVDFNLDTVLSDIIKLFQAEVAAKGLAILTDFNSFAGTIRNDPQRLTQVVINLLVNAINFTDSGNITVATRHMKSNSVENMVKISITDTGVGMNSKEKANLFQRFTQPTSKNTFHEYGGSGLGLYISKNLVKLMGGDFSVESEKGKGSTFSFTILDDHSDGDTLESQTAIIEVTKPLNISLPLNSVSAMNESPESPSQECVKKQIRTILLVEDNKINQNMMKRLLTMKGYEVLIVDNGKLALSAFETKSFDLIIMDIQMPIMDGITATKEIRKLEKLNAATPIPIVGLSGNAREFHAVNALNSGLNRYMTKPVNKAELYAVLEQFEQESVCQ
ncbi:hypothetical protein INT44_000583 [Umbelopsis vinacea]|uniref:histidine kinase n=1 Tax=Umbelopsis vinacea TaxID=44442 RepID=A0A8H7Q8K1_9FUNG|nr:hypothetical protein INT44_000583 [Umbelopsis vinacea]